MRGIVGGMFDPIHFGHYKPALELAPVLGLTEIRLIPCGHPPHRDPPMASAEHRWNMTNLIANSKLMIADDRELNRDGPSYMVDTLRSLKAEAPTPMCLLLGTDALLGVPHWDRADELLELCHIVVSDRPGEGAVTSLPVFWQERCTREREVLQERSAGSIYLYEGTRFDCASRQIRAQIQAGEAPRFCVPGSVYSYIRRHHLYGA